MDGGFAARFGRLISCLASRAESGLRGDESASESDDAVDAVGECDLKFVAEGKVRRKRLADSDDTRAILIRSRPWVPPAVLGRAVELDLDARLGPWKQALRGSGYTELAAIDIARADGLGARRVGHASNGRSCAPVWDTRLAVRMVRKDHSLGPGGGATSSE